MGLFDKLFNKGAKTLSGREVSSYEPEKSFDEKLVSIIQNAGSYELRRNISPDELEKEFGREVYTRGNRYCNPDNITYAVYEGGNRILYIRLWETYQDYSHVTNREILKFCRENGVKMLDFFDYLPNEEYYMVERIKEQL